MSELQVIEATLERAARRRRWARALHGLWLGLLVGGAVWLAALCVYKLRPIPISSLLWAAGIALAVRSGVHHRRLAQIPMSETARWWT